MALQNGKSGGTQRREPKGRLIIIGGNERAEGSILKEVAEAAIQSGKPLLVVSASSAEPERTQKAHCEVFTDLGVKKIEMLDIRIREDALKDENIRKAKNTDVIFFTGGDQVRLVHKIGDSPIFLHLRDVYWQGGTIAGTSSGAAAMPATMITDGPADESPDMASLQMAPGFGFLDGVIIDSHFAERGRIGRLLGIVAQNSKNLGIGIDEDTAIVVEGTKRFRVMGSGGVYIVDGSKITYSSLSEKERPRGILTIHDIMVHVLSKGDEFDLKKRRPIVTEEERRGEAVEDSQQDSEQ